MAKEDIFGKEFVDERDKANLEGVLEQLNMPPAVVGFVRDHKRLVQVGMVLLVITVVTGSFYHSYRQRRIEAASSALSVAMQREGQERLDGLAEVERKFSGTTAARWAEISIAHDLLREGKAEEAKQHYLHVREKTGTSSPLHPLVTIAIAQADKVLEDYQEAAREYQSLAKIKGYEGYGSIELAGIYEVQGKKEEALHVYENYLATMAPEEPGGQKRLVEEKIAHLKASM